MEDSVAVEMLASYEDLHFLGFDQFSLRYLLPSFAQMSSLTEEKSGPCRITIKIEPETA